MKRTLIFSLIVALAAFSLFGCVRPEPVAATASSPVETEPVSLVPEKPAFDPNFILEADQLAVPDCAPELVRLGAYANSLREQARHQQAKGLAGVECLMRSAKLVDESREQILASLSKEERAIALSYERLASRR